MKNNIVKGYKVFNPDWTCRGFKFEIGKTYEEDVELDVCVRGFHFCEKAADCFNYYDFNHNNKVAEIEALGEVKTDGDKSCTNKILIVREIEWEELLKLVNTGKHCTGRCNTGDCNTGNRNTGDWNTGNWNTGDWNTGNRNTGNWNTGDWNTGNWNTGNRNTGDCNTGNWNTGDWNTGNRNTGDCNTGNWNTGNRNTGNWNTGDCNTGNWNTGNWNTGDWNTGNWNTGNWNKSSFNTGCFNTEQNKILMFNKPSNWTYEDWLISDARYLLNKIPKSVVEWISSNNMTDEEKENNPTHETTGGYLKILDEKDCAQIWWDGLEEEERNVIKSLPNFDGKIFEETTGINICKGVD